METKRNAVGWWEIPVENMEQATKFYETVFNIKLEKTKFGEFDMAMWPYDQEKPGAPGALVKHDTYKPGADGPMMYFTSHSGDLNNELERVEDAGGKILESKKSIGEHGFMAIVMDTEGNRIALHSLK